MNHLAGRSNPRKILDESVDSYRRQVLASAPQFMHRGKSRYCPENYSQLDLAILVSMRCAVDFKRMFAIQQCYTLRKAKNHQCSTFREHSWIFIAQSPHHVDCRDIYRIRKQTVWSSRLTTLTLVIKRSAQYQ